MNEFFHLTEKFSFYDYAFKKVIWFSDEIPHDSAGARHKAGEFVDKLSGRRFIFAAFTGLLDAVSQEQFIYFNCEGERQGLLYNPLRQLCCETALGMLSLHALSQLECLPVDDIDTSVLENNQPLSLHALRVPLKSIISEDYVAGFVENSTADDFITTIRHRVADASVNCLRSLGDSPVWMLLKKLCALMPISFKLPFDIDCLAFILALLRAGRTMAAEIPIIRKLSTPQTATMMIIVDVELFSFLGHNLCRLHSHRNNGT